VKKVCLALFSVTKMIHLPLSWFFQLSNCFRLSLVRSRVEELLHAPIGERCSNYGCHSLDSSLVLHF
jgi:hypothetical protein